MKKLLLLRHAKSDWRIDTSDFNRPLKKRGVKNAKQMGKYLYQQAIFPDLIISSPANRALSTAKLVAKKLHYSNKQIDLSSSLYGAGVADFLDILSAVDDEVNCVMMVSHNPGIENLLSYFVPSITIPLDGKLLPTAALAYLEFDVCWKNLHHSSFYKPSLIHNYWVQRAKELCI